MFAPDSMTKIQTFTNVKKNTIQAQPHLKLGYGDSSVEFFIHFKGTDGAGQPHGHRGVGNDRKSAVHVSARTHFIRTRGDHCGEHYNAVSQFAHTAWWNSAIGVDLCRGWRTVSWCV